MRLSFWLPNSLTWDDTLAAGQFAASLGYSGLWYADHFMPNAPSPADGPIHEAFTMLAALAVSVPEVQLGTMVAGNTYRHPAVLAKQAVTIDHLSGGRFVLGMGAGWQENEHLAYGLTYETFRWRFDRLEEALQVITSLLGAPRTTFAGTHYSLAEAPLDPKPVHGTMPILIGGRGPNRTLPLVAQYADAWNMWGTPAMMAEAGAVLDVRCEAIGRDPKSLHRTAAALVYVSEDAKRVAELRGHTIERPTVIGTPEDVAAELTAYARAGVRELVVPGFAYRSDGQREENLSLLLRAAQMIS